jgi:nitrogen regulatory protein PII
LSLVESKLSQARMCLSITGVDAVTVPFVTGRGRHSARGVAKIREAVEGCLRQEGIPYTLHNAGGLLVATLTADAQ